MSPRLDIRVVRRGSSYDLSCRLAAQYDSCTSAPPRGEPTAALGDLSRGLLLALPIAPPLRLVGQPDSFGSSKRCGASRSIRPRPPNMHFGRGRRAGSDRARRKGRNRCSERLRDWRSGKAMGGRWTGAGVAAARDERRAVRAGERWWSSGAAGGVGVSRGRRREEPAPRRQRLSGPWVAVRGAR
jgi:hypothetical protein